MFEILGFELDALVIYCVGCVCLRCDCFIITWFYDFWLTLLLIMGLT